MWCSRPRVFIASAELIIIEQNTWWENNKKWCKIRRTSQVSGSGRIRPVAGGTNRNNAHAIMAGFLLHCWTSNLKGATSLVASHLLAESLRRSASCQSAAVRTHATSGPASRLIYVKETQRAKNWLAVVIASVFAGCVRKFYVTGKWRVPKRIGRPVGRPAGWRKKHAAQRILETGQPSDAMLAPTSPPAYQKPSEGAAWRGNPGPLDNNPWINGWMDGYRYSHRHLKSSLITPESRIFRTSVVFL
jgi:hypothetical protein